MTVRWERFAGSTDSFAVRIALMTDPDLGAAAQPDEAASWGALQIWVAGQNLCAHVDQGEVLQSVHWYLLPLLEWLVESWNALLHEEKLPNRNIGETAAAALGFMRNPPALAGEAETVAWEEEWYEWRGRHALRAARAGGLLPNIVFRRLRDAIEISWEDEPLAGMPVGFAFGATSGVALIEPDRVAQPLFDVLGAIVEYLHRTNGGARFTALRQDIEQLTRAEQHSRRLDWLAGLRELPSLPGRLRGNIPQHEMHGRWSEIVAALRAAGDDGHVAAALEVEETPLVITGSCHAALLFSSISPTVTQEDVRTLASVLVEQYTTLAVDPPLRELIKQMVADSTIPAWEQGYELAEMVHSQLNLDISAGWVDVASLLDALGVAILSRRLEDRDIRACCIVGPHHLPTIVRNEMSPFFEYPSAQRFSLAHELCHLLFDRSHGQKLAIVSGPWAPRVIERRANAFAAMFLMPTELVAAAIADVPDPISDLDGISAVANRLHVSRHATIEHLYNLTLMSESDRDELLRQVQD